MKLAIASSAVLAIALMTPLHRRHSSPYSGRKAHD